MQGHVDVGEQLLRLGADVNARVKVLIPLYDITSKTLVLIALVLVRRISHTMLVNLRLLCAWRAEDYNLEVLHIWSCSG